MSLKQCLIIPSTQSVFDRKNQITGPKVILQLTPHLVLGCGTREKLSKTKAGCEKSSVSTNFLLILGKMKITNHKEQVWKTTRHSNRFTKPTTCQHEQLFRRIRSHFDRRRSWPSRRNRSFSVVIKITVVDVGVDKWRRLSFFGRIQFGEDHC